MMISWKGILSI